MLKSMLAALVALLPFSAEGKEMNANPPADAAHRANTFAFELYQQQTKQEEGNLVFSPTSVQIALAMASAGAGGETLKQMQQVLGLSSGDPADAHRAEGKLLAALLQPTPPGRAPSILRISNNLWLSDQFSVNLDYARRLADVYRSTTTPLNLSDPAGAAKTINDAIARQTNDKIKNLIAPANITPLTRLILTNAVYFKADWASKFNADATRDQPFHLSATRKVDVKLMHDSQITQYFENDQLKAVELPYVYRTMSMWVVMPKAVDGLSGVEKKIADLPKWIAGAKKRDVHVGLPKFKFESIASLPKALSAMGMNLAFEPANADFTGISTAEGLFIGDVLHQAMINVNENGTEAAAATAVMMGATAMPPQAEPADFLADRPFVLVLRHNQTGAILFMGRVADPTK